jgi:hypothetical protein
MLLTGIDLRNCINSLMARKHTTINVQLVVKMIHYITEGVRY